MAERFGRFVDDHLRLGQYPCTSVGMHSWAVCRLCAVVKAPSVNGYKPVPRTVVFRLLSLSELLHCSHSRDHNRRDTYLGVTPHAITPLYPDTTVSNLYRHATRRPGDFPSYSSPQASHDVLRHLVQGHPNHVQEVHAVGAFFFPHDPVSSVSAYLGSHWKFTSTMRPS